MNSKMKIKKIRPKQFSLDLFEYLFVIVLILECNTNYIVIKETMSFTRKLILILLGLSVLGQLLFGKISFKTLKHAFNHSIALLLFLLVLIFLNHYNVPVEITLSFAAILLCFNHFANQNSIKEILKKYVNIIFLLAIISLFLWLFGSILNVIEASGYVSSTWFNSRAFVMIKNYHYLYFETQTINLLNFPKIIRNSSVFAEAPMASLNFTLAVLFELFINNDISWTKVIIIVIAVCTTFSVTGIIVCFVSLIVFFLLDDNKKAAFRVFRFLIIPVVILVAINEGSQMVINKLTSTSGSIRLDDFSIGMKVWKSHLLLGCGIGNMDRIRSYMGSWRGVNQGFSNSPTLILAQGGIVLFSLYLIPIVKGIIECRKDYRLLYFILCFIILFTFSYIPYKYLTFFLLFVISDLNHV